MLRPLFLAFALLTTGVALTACNDEGEIDLCSDDLDCDDGFICEITGQDDGICIEDL